MTKGRERITTDSLPTQMAGFAVQTVIDVTRRMLQNFGFIGPELIRTRNIPTPPTPISTSPSTPPTPLPPAK